MTPKFLESNYKGQNPIGLKKKLYPWKALGT
jgi:hypothetical protein